MCQPLSDPQREHETESQWWGDPVPNRGSHQVGDAHPQKWHKGHRGQRRLSRPSDQVDIAWPCCTAALQTGLRNWTNSAAPHYPLTGPDLKLIGNPTLSLYGSGRSLQGARGEEDKEKVVKWLKHCRGNADISYLLGQIQTLIYSSHMAYKGHFLPSQTSWFSQATCLTPGLASQQQLLLLGH